MSLLLATGSTPPTFKPDEDYDPGFLTGIARRSSSFSFAAPLLAVALGAGDDFAPPAIEDSTSTVQTQPWATTSPPRLLFVDEDVPPLRGQPDEDFDWRALTGPPFAAPQTLYQRLPYLQDPEEVSANTLRGQPDEDFWQNAVAPVSATHRVQLPLGDPEEIPAGTLRGQPDEDYILWLPPAAPLAYARLVIVDDDLPVTPAATIADEDYWTNLVAPVQATLARFTPPAEEVPGTLSGQPDEDFWINPVAPVPATVYQRLPIGDPEEISAGSLRGQPDEDFWKSHVTPVSPSVYQRLPIGDPEEISAGSLTGQPDEDFWKSGVAPVQATSRVSLPLGDPEEIPVGGLFGQPDEDFWNNHVAPVAPTVYQRLPLGDVEELPANALSGQPDEDFWKNHVAPVPASVYQRLPIGDPEEIPAGALSGQPDEDYWQNAVPLVAATVYQQLPPGDPEELSAGLLSGQPDDDFWELQLRIIAESTAIARSLIYVSQHVTRFTVNDGALLPPTAIIDASGGALKVVISNDAPSPLAIPITLEVPALALSTTVPVQILVTDPPELPNVTVLSMAIVGLPEDLAFNVPARITIATLDGSDAPANARIYWSNGSGGFDALPSTVVGAFVSAEIHHFSGGFVGVSDAPSPSSGSSSQNSGGGGDPYDPAYYNEATGEIVYESEIRARAAREAAVALREVALVETNELEFMVESSEVAALVNVPDAAAGVDFGEPEATVETPQVRASVDPGDDPTDPDT